MEAVACKETGSTNSPFKIFLVTTHPSYLTFQKIILVSGHRTCNVTFQNVPVKDEIISTSVQLFLENSFHETVVRVFTLAGRFQYMCIVIVNAVPMSMFFMDSFIHFMPTSTYSTD